MASTENVQPPLTAIEEQRLERIYKKLNNRIITGIWVAYFLTSAISNNVGLALTMNEVQGHSIEQKLLLSPHQIAVGVALFFVAIVIFETPATLIMSRVAPHAWLSRTVLTVGIVAACHGALSSAWNFYLLRFLLGVAEAGLWPGFTYYIMLFYPPRRAAKLIGYYFTAAQLSTAIVGLVSAGFQLMDGAGGLTGYAWMFLIWGLLTVLDAVAILWWLPDRPRLSTDPEPKGRWRLLVPRQRAALTGEEAELHYKDMQSVYHPRPWTLTDVLHICLDWHVWPLIVMYFGVIAVGYGITSYGTLIIQAINPSFSGIEISLLFAPIWIVDGIGVLILTPISDRYHTQRAAFFSFSCSIVITGLLVTDFAPHPWPRYVGLLLIGLGLGSTYCILMTWSAELFQKRYGEVGVAAAAGLVSGLGNLGSVFATYALYSGWPSDSTTGYGYRDSNLVMIGVIVLSIVCALGLHVGLVLEAKHDANKAMTEEASEKPEEKA